MSTYYHDPTTKVLYVVPPLHVSTSRHRNKPYLHTISVTAEVYFLYPPESGHPKMTTQRLSHSEEASKCTEQETLGYFHTFTIPHSWIELDRDEFDKLKGELNEEWEKRKKEIADPNS